jgi:hypothetical protein
MKKIQFILVAFLSFVFLTSHQRLLSECPECNYSRALLDITPENSRFLWYFTFYNIFDSASVECTIGEFYVENNGIKTKCFPYLEPSLRLCNWKILGQSAPGEDTILTQVAKTLNFTYRPNSRVIFFRELVVGIPCGLNPPPRDTNRYYGDDANFWVAFPGVILDTSEWVIQLVDANTNEVLWTIDSVGIATNYDSPIARYYGTNPIRMNQIRDLPNEFAGDTVYIRISTRRYGPTPFGMWLYLSPISYSLSTFREYGKDCYFPGHACNFDYDDFERNYYFPRLIEYLDSVVAARGGPLKFEDLPGKQFWASGDLLDSLYTRYFNKWYINDTMYFWVERGDSIAPRIGIWPSREGPTKTLTSPDGTKITYFYDAETKTFVFRSNARLENCRIKVFNLLGNLLWESQSFQISEGINKVVFPSSIIPNGVAIIQIIDSEGSIVFSGKEIFR